MTRPFMGFLLASVSAVLIAFSPAGAQPQQNYQLLGPNDAVAKVNGVSITKGQLEGTMNNLLPFMTYHQSVSDERYLKIQRKALNTLIETELIYDFAKKNKLDKIDKKELDKAVNDAKKNVPKGDSFEKVLKRSNMTVNDLREMLKKERVVTKVSAEKRDEFGKKASEAVTEEFLRDYYNKNKEKFMEPERFHLRSILVKADPGGGAVVWNESKRKAEEILKQARSGKDFAKLAEEFSEDPYAKSGGDMGWAHVGSVFEEIEEAVASAEVGKIVGPVMTIHGYHLVKVEGRKPPVQKKFEDLDLDKLNHELREKEYKKYWSEWMKGVKDAAKIEYVLESLKE
ncbi:MAG: peptidylprolyl isomerase [Deltaproteobacteria bacterium]|nr:peptidylprolyl isomerase [Deltaproteobacteria bacterium]MBZ0220070.1 peptidylprolyl isomerase [Deltaproteobacteria bacterium]